MNDQIAVGDEAQDAIYRQLRSRYEADPNSLSDVERAVLLMVGIGRIQDLKERREAEFANFEKNMQERYSRALLIVDSVEKGTYAGDDAYLEYRQYVNPDWPPRLMKIHQYGWAERVIQLNNRMGRALGWYE